MTEEPLGFFFTKIAQGALRPRTAPFPFIISDPNLTGGQGIRGQAAATMPPVTLSPPKAPNREEPDRVVHRVSLACLPCRSRHMKCSAEKPICSRCVADSLECTYARSRRGHRRAKRQGQASPQDQRHNHAQVLHQLATQTPPAHSPTSSASGAGTTRDSGPGSNSTTLTIPNSLQSENIPGSGSIDEDLIGLYYTYFHAAHPCVLPRWALFQHYSTNPEAFAPILLVMQYIGSLFDPAVDSAPFKLLATDFLPPGLAYTGNRFTPHQVQAVLLFSIALYWSDEIERGVQALDAGIKAALGMRMHLVPFATEHGRGDPVLEESWRRTWWQLYVTDAHIAGSTHTFPTRISNIEVNAALPCEEECYESGVYSNILSFSSSMIDLTILSQEIPLARTLKEYDMREFLPDDDPGFSSFAHLVGLTRTLDVVLSRNAPTAQSIATVCAQTDISMMAWSSLLPKSKRALLNNRQEVDMQLFKANMLVNTLVHLNFVNHSYSAPPILILTQRFALSLDMLWIFTVGSPTWHTAMWSP